MTEERRDHRRWVRRHPVQWAAAKLEYRRLWRALPREQREFLRLQMALLRGQPPRPGLVQLSLAVPDDARELEEP